MSLDSIFFISCFLPLVLLAGWLVPQKGKTAALLALSLLFYAFCGLPALAVLALSITINYLLSLLLQKKCGKLLLGLGIAANVALLGAYKYLDFLLSQFGLGESVTGLVAPLGISFFTFKCIAYLADVYKGREEKPQFLRFALYVSFFPQIAMGPITRYGEFASQMDIASMSLQSAACGLRRFVVGLAKRVVISAPLGILVDGVFAAALPDARLAWLGAVCYCLQLYFDFSGFIDMANGIANMLGFTVRENFDHPYTAISIGDFWRRWHMSLSAWFKDYIYIPLGGNRKGSFRAGVNKCIVFLLCGIWHGANWTFLLWGIWHGALSLLESLQLIPAKKLAASRPGRIVGRVYALLAVCLGFVMFRAADVGAGFAMLSAMFTGFSFTAQATVLLHELLTGEVLVMLVLGIVLSVPVSRLLKKLPGWERWSETVTLVLTLALFALCILRLASGNFAPSIYAQF